MSHISVTGKRWNARTPRSPDASIPAWIQTLDLPRVVAECLRHRLPDGLDEGKRDSWLNPTLDALHDPWKMQGMDAAIRRLELAIQQTERIRIVTDYDVDGTTSSLILQTSLHLRGLTSQVDYHIPNRFSEGYGFSVAAAQKAADDGVSLILTADIGVRDTEAVTAARQRGVDVIICDHHLPAGSSVPTDATAVLCPPQESCQYSNQAIAACGVSLKLAQALLVKHPKRDRIILSMLKLAAIGTVADVVDLSTPENRAIVAIGLRQLRSGPHAPGLQALLDVARVTLPQLQASDLGFRIGPRINAAGRLTDARAVVDLIQERDPGRARAKATALDRLNQERQTIQRKLTAQCVQKLDDNPPPFVLMWGTEAEGWHPGVVGIVASKVRSQVHRPTAIVSVPDNPNALARGSVRSISGVHAVRALESGSDLLERFGGHPAAAGFSIKRERLPQLHQTLCAWMETNADAASFIPELAVDAECTLDDLTDQLADSLASLGPFGKGNTEPRLLVRGVRPTHVRPLKEHHLKLQFGKIDAVWWGGAPHAPVFIEPVDMVFSLGFNHWRGRRTLQITVEDVRALQSPVDSPPDPSPQRHSAPKE